jgi:hypothetical protein
MGLFEDIQKMYLDSRKARDAFASNVLSLLVSDLKYEALNRKKELDDGDVTAVLQKTLKTRKDALAEFEKAGRTDLSEKEKAEIEYLSKLLPPMLRDEELKNLVAEVKRDLGASTPADMGKMMKEVLARAKGRADGVTVKNLVTEALKSA